MILTRIVPLFFVLFTSFTLWVLATSSEGFWQVFFSLFTERESLQVVLDLGIAVLLLMYFLYRDHVAHGGHFRSFAPFLIAMPFLGVIAPLTYLTLRAMQPRWFIQAAPSPKRT